MQEEYDYPVWESMKKDKITRDEAVLMVVYVFVTVPLSYAICYGGVILAQFLGVVG